MKIVCVYHEVDLDGWISAAIVKHYYLLENNSIAAAGGDINNIEFIGYKYGQPVPDLSEYDKVIMCDISFPKEEMEKLANKLVWIDHHISAILQLDVNPIFYNEAKGIRDTKFAACELTWKYFFPNETMPEIVRLLGRYDCFGYNGTSEEKEVLEFQYGVRNVIGGYQAAYSWLISSIEGNQIDDIKNIGSIGKTIYSYLCQEAKQIYNTKFDLYFDSIKITNTDHALIGEGRKVKFASINRTRFNPINFGIDYHTDGYDGVACFWYEDNKLCFSLYNDNGEVDCSTIAKRYGGGGHKGASGFVLKTTKTYTNMNLFDLVNKLGSLTI